MDFKKHLFVIIVAAVVLLAIGGYFLVVPSITEEADKQRQACENKAKAIADAAAKAQQPDGLKTQKHLDLASKYDQTLQKQIADVEKIWADRNRLDVHYEPLKDTTFDMWLTKTRDAITATAKQANLSLPDDFQVKTFRETNTNDQAKDESLTSKYRLRHMAIIEEIVNVLSKKLVKQEVEVFDPQKPDAKKSIDVGASALEKFTIAAKPRMPSDQSALWTDILSRANPNGKAAPKTGTFQELPYTVLTVDLTFIAPLSSVPAYIKALETSQRWMGVISRVDFQRTVAPFPSGDKRLETAGPVDGLNTYYQEAPVRVLLTLDIYENDKAREEEFNKSLVAAAPTPTAATKAAK